MFNQQEHLEFSKFARKTDDVTNQNSRISTMSAICVAIRPPKDMDFGGPNPTVPLKPRGIDESSAKAAHHCPHFSYM